MNYRMNSGRGANSMGLFLGLDSPGNDLGNVGVTAVPAIIQEINNRANPFDVVAFNNNGWIKSKLAPPVSNIGLLAGYYVRGDKA
jgi:hypothetical protein